MKLSFATITCSRCGGERLMTQACPDCGLRPRRHEIQPDLMRRQKILAELEARGPSEPSKRSAMPRDVDSAVSEIPGLVANVQRALSRAAREGRSASELATAFSELDARVRYWSHRQPRPETNRARNLGRSLGLLREGLGIFASALGAPSMLAAQSLQTQGQDRIKAALAQIALINEIDEANDLLASSDSFARIGLSARAAAGGDGPLAALDERLLQMAGHRVETPSTPGLGLNLHLFRFLMLSLLDYEECLEVAQFAERHMGDLARVCVDPRWQARHGVVTAQLASATFNLSNIEGSTDLEAATSAMQLVMQCRDGVIRHCLATLLAEDAEQFAQLSRQKAGQVIKHASRKYPELRLEENLTELLRHAGAHYDYDIEDDCFVTHDSTGQVVRICLEDYIDQVLGYLQTSVSLLMAVLTATSTQDVPLELSRHTSERDILSIITVLLGLLGFREPVLVRQGVVLHVAASGDPADLTTGAAAVAGLLPESVDQLSARITDSDGELRYWEAPLGPFRQYLRRDPRMAEVDETLAFVGAVSAVRIDSRSVWDENAWASIAAQILHTTKNDSLRSRVIRVKKMRNLARSSGQDQVAHVLTTALQAIREGGAQSAQVPAAFERRGGPG